MDENSIHSACVFTRIEMPSYEPIFHRRVRFHRAAFVVYINYRKLTYR